MGHGGHILRRGHDLEWVGNVGTGFSDSDLRDLQRMLTDLVGDEPFAVLLPDMIMAGEPGCLKAMVSLYEQTGGNVIGLQAAQVQALRQVITL